MVERLLRGTDRFITVIGAAGVGKSTLARRLAWRCASDGYMVWEHRPQFPLNSADWIACERRLHDADLSGILLVDDCTDQLRQVNLLAEHIATQEEPALRLMLTASIGEWRPRLKASVLFSQGTILPLSQLVDSEIEALLNLVSNRSEIRALVDHPFSQLSRVEQRRTLRRRCSADMYVCLKNIFATEGLDTILLREYASLPDEVQDVYRCVAAIEAAGAQVHRQLIVRLLILDIGTIQSMLDRMEGIVEEFDIKADDGIFGWATRHKVIAETITKYKFADQADRHDLLRRVVDQLNPATFVELRAIRDLCDREFGVGSLLDRNHRLEIYRRMIALAPGERVPWHQLISDLIFDGRLDEAEQEVRHAEAAVHTDSPINRFKVRIALRRAQDTEGILPEDRRAMLLRAEQTALVGIRRWSEDKWAYKVYAEVGVAMAELDRSVTVLDDAIAQLRSALDRILDPELSEWLDDFERQRRKYG